ncbi:hypothetical protein BC936DRAFT_142417 [Jimgerdemannia flammicorona]|uniref:Uncharacterized protein n=2 Tax=Jimgerdemannia flammicorona TaxID=994334 RepID=A0A433PTP8_9FUNG|nr:hypothetical protein BC936DRAFT_142417 [Jimgerdemannia flammicorona]RUS20912.1 hypothetical protein BC938DRAFT_475487 [Jimgerdemannia flammicorona]
MIMANTNEEISTIFVVGFPDDMQEREFQNMFIFSPGFEAATLKIPSKDQDDDLSVNGVNGNGTNPRKQIIGFAKFRTRLEALEARDILSGRKVDAEKGSVLKAEMAKKNLHTKRGLSNDQPTAQAFPIIPSSSIVGSTGKRFNSTSAYDAFYSVPCAPALPSDLLSPDYSYDFYADMYAPGTPTTPVFNDSPFTAAARAGSFDARHDSLGGLVSSARAPIGFNTAHRYSKGFLEIEDPPTHPLSYLSKSVPVHSERGFNSVLFGNDDLAPTARFGSLSINTGAGPLPSPGLPSPSLPSPGFRPPNPADQNPPCNTLYVGNLPPNTSEEELKQLFQRCVGYKRLCFRNKPNGPMCFVEFEDVTCATQALNDLYGNPLSNSVKGGIRLSYSKNPLGVRQNTSGSISSISSIGSINPLASANPLTMSTGISPLTIGTFSFPERRDSFTFDPQLS